MVSDSAEVQVIVNLAAAWSTASAWQRSEEPIVRIGGVQGGDSATQFTDVQSMTRLSDGRIAILETASSEIRWFNASGTHLGTRGRRGRGPGEFNLAAMIVRLPGDTLLVEDRPSVDHVYFGPDMEFVREESFDRIRFSQLGPWTECLGQSLSDRSIIACRSEGRKPEVPGHRRTYSRLVRVTRSLDSIYSLGRLGGYESWGVEKDGRVRFARHPFYSVGHVAVGGDPPRLAVALNPHYEIELWTLDGRLERVVRRVGARRMPTDEERREADQLVAESAHGDAVLLSRFQAAMQVPDTIPAVYGVELGALGDLWVLREGILRSQVDAVYDIFDPNGLYLGEIRFPRDFRAIEVGVDYVLGVRRDENDVPFVEMYGLDRRGGIS